MTAEVAEASLFMWSIAREVATGAVSWKTSIRHWHGCVSCGYNLRGSAHAADPYIGNARLFLSKKIVFDLLFVLCRRFSFQICLNTGRNARLFYLKNVSFRVKHGHIFSLFGVRGYPRRPSFKKVCKPHPKTSKFYHFWSPFWRSFWRFLAPKNSLFFRRSFFHTFCDFGISRASKMTLFNRRLYKYKSLAS